jgi:phosphopantothenoylcysteine decarboxylase/phosphopantothenate--cysteine ligase
MGYAVAEALTAAGAETTLVSGPTALDDPRGVSVTRVQTAAEMHEAVMSGVGDCDLFVAAAAVADYRPETTAAGKIKKTADCMELRLIRNPDILAQVAALPDGPFTLGFAAETHEVESYAEAKLHEKRLDMIAANQVGDGLGFESDDNALTVLWRNGRRELSRAGKATLARELVQLLVEIMKAR